MEVDQIAEGLWRWTATHPDWTPDADWPADVGCVYYEAEESVVLIDPLVPEDAAERERFLRALDRDVEKAGRPLAILITVFWHRRSAAELVERFEGATLWANRAALDRLELEVSNPFDVGDALPAGIQAHDADRRDEVLFWIPEHRALVAGDVLLGTEDGGLRPCPDSWLPENVTPEEFRAGLRRLLELPVEMVLVSHGEPILEGGRAALEKALDG